jgi:hypothetical protein
MAIGMGQVPELGREMPTTVAPRRDAFILAGAALLATLLTLNQAGLSVDEVINTNHGKSMVRLLLTNPAGLLDAAAVDRLYRAGHEHPPLARFLIGVAHAPFDPAPKEVVIEPKGGRAASALAYALLVWLTVRQAARLGGRRAGWFAGLALMLCPRVFGHAHHAAPEMIHAAFVMLALDQAGRAFRSPVATEPEATRSTVSPIRLGSWAAVILAGFCLGLALLTKLTAVLIPPILGAALLVGERWRALPNAVVWGVTGTAVFIVGWPWLWPFDLPGYPPGFGGTVARLREFLSVGVNRATIYTWYFGAQFPAEGRPVPWHYPWFHAAFTMPVGVLALGVIGTVRALVADRRVPVLLPALTLPLTLLFFSGPVAKYDGERLFLFALAPFAGMAGLGAEELARLLIHRLGGLSWPRLAIPALLVGMMASDAGGLIRLHPAQLSHWSAAIGGLPGAERLGMDLNYWGDSLTPRLLDRLAAELGPNEKAWLLPTLFPGHAVYQKSGRLELGTVEPGDRFDPASGGLVLLFRRDSYLHDPLPSSILQHGEVRAEFAVDGVWLARVIRVAPGAIPSR